MEEAEFRELTKTRLELLMPVLHDGGWSNRATCLHQWLLLPPGPETPLIGYGENHEDRFSFLVMKQAAFEGLNLLTLHDLAIANLKERPNRPIWEIGEVPFQGSGHPLLSRGGDELTASDVLDPACLAEAHEHLGADQILVGMPSRSVLLASRENLGPGLINLLSLAFHHGEIGRRGLPHAGGVRRA